MRGDLHARLRELRAVRLAHLDGALAVHARRRRRRPGAHRAGDLRRHLPGADAPPGVCALRPHRGLGAGGRAGAGRLDHRQLFLALGVPDQPSGRAAVAAARASFRRGAAGTRRGPAARARRRTPARRNRLRPGGARLWRAADRARSVQSRRRLLVELHHRAERARGGGASGAGGARAGDREADHQSAAVRPLSGLRDLLRVNVPGRLRAHRYLPSSCPSSPRS